MGDLEYRKTSQEFRRLASNMLNTTHEEGNLHLIRLRMFIEKNQIVSKIINQTIKDVTYDKPIINDDDRYNIFVDVPIGQEEHIKAIYEYLIEMTQEELDLRGIAIEFHCESRKYTDCIRNYLNKVFKPLVDYIIDKIGEKMMENEVGSKTMNINIDKNYGTNNFSEGGQINSINTVSNNEADDISKLINEVITLISQEQIDEELKAEIIDDIEEVGEQLQSENPKMIKIKKSCKNIKDFLLNIPAGIAHVTGIATALNVLLEEAAKVMGQFK